MIKEHPHFKIKVFFDAATFTLSYVVYDEKSKDAVIIDSVLDFDSHSGEYSYTSAQKVVDFIKEQEL